VTDAAKAWRDMARFVPSQTITKGDKYGEKNWKFSANDVKERECWEDYHGAFENVFSHTSTKWAPWYVIPADHKWFTHIAVADIIISKLKSLHLKYPTVDKDRMQELEKAKQLLENE